MFNMKRSVKMKNIFGMAAAILMAAFGLVSLTSCENELAEQFTVEVVGDIPAGFDGDNPLKELDYFTLTLERIPEDVVAIDFGNGFPGASNNPFDVVDPDNIIFWNKKLYKGDILRLDNLEPGKYKLRASAYKASDGDDEELGDPFFGNSVGSVLVECNNMDEFGNIIVERGYPIVIKLIVKFGR